MKWCVGPLANTVQLREMEQARKQRWLLFSDERGKTAAKLKWVELLSLTQPETCLCCYHLFTAVSSTTENMVITLQEYNKDSTKLSLSH